MLKDCFRIDRYKFYRTKNNKYNISLGTINVGSITMELLGDTIYLYDYYIKNKFIEPHLNNVLISLNSNFNLLGSLTETLYKQLEVLNPIYKMGNSTNTELDEFILNNLESFNITFSIDKL